MTQDIESQKQRLILSLRTENAKNMRPMTVMIILVKKKKKKLSQMLLSKSYEIQRVKMKVLFFSLFLFLNTICILQQFKMFLNNFFNLVLLCEDNELHIRCIPTYSE